nr:T-cell-specific guanine nucleotide triphosphate-binding protein 1-like [Cavia porcellus]
MTKPQRPNGSSDWLSEPVADGSRQCLWHPQVLLLHTIYIEDATSACYSLCTVCKNLKMKSQTSSQQAWGFIRSHLEQGNLREAASAIKAALEDMENEPLSIAVTGESGAGMSTFINALRGTWDEEEGVAPTGPMATTLQEYLKEIPDCDLFFIIFATRLKCNDIELAKAIAQIKKKVYFIQTKIDNALVSCQKARPLTFDKDKVLQEIRNCGLAQLQEARVVADKIFLVSSLDVCAYDFPELQSTLVRDLPAHKRHAFMQRLSSVTEAAVNGKRDSLKQKIWLEALKAGAWAAVPLVGLFSDSERKKLEDTLSLYRSHFGVDDESLEKMAQDLHVSLEDLKANLQSPDLLSAESDESFWEKTKQMNKFLHRDGGGLTWRRPKRAACFLLLPRP